MIARYLSIFSLAALTNAFAAFAPPLSVILESSLYSQLSDECQDPSPTYPDGCDVEKS